MPKVNQKSSIITNAAKRDAMSPRKQIWSPYWGTFTLKSRLTDYIHMLHQRDYSCQTWTSRGERWEKLRLNDPKLSMLRLEGKNITLVAEDSIKEGLRRSFAEKANEFSLLLDTISLSITKFEGVLEVSPCYVNLMTGSI
jgi:hypothetical protein